MPRRLEKQQEGSCSWATTALSPWACFSGGCIEGCKEAAGQQGWLSPAAAEPAFVCWPAVLAVRLVELMPQMDPTTLVQVSVPCAAHYGKKHTVEQPHRVGSIA